MLREAVKDEPNMDVIQTCKILEAEAVTNANPHKIHTLDSTALFVFKGQAEKDKAKENAQAQVMRDMKAKRVPKVRSAQELENLIKLEMQRMEDEVAENFAKACDAAEFVESLPNDQGEYDESALPEWLVEQVSNKLLEAGLNTYSDGKSRYERARSFMREAPMAAMEGALKFLKAMDPRMTEDEVLKEINQSNKEVEELFEKLLSPGSAPSRHGEPTIDNPPVGETTRSEKRYSHSLSYEQRHAESPQAQAQSQSKAKVTPTEAKARKASAKRTAGKTGPTTALGEALNKALAS
jgi:hypothetical protein